jgi:DsbC/DsbD-like thiol-disulfide interchange protein
MARQTLFRLVTAAALLAAVALAVGTAVDAGDKKSKSEVKVTAKASKIDDAGKQTVTVLMEINPGWYAYANPVGFEDLVNAQTTVKIASKTKLESVKIDYPAGKLKLDGKDSYRIYEDKVSITAAVQRAKGDTGPLDVTVKFMTCNAKGFCLPPETVKLTVP